MSTSTYKGKDVFADTASSEYVSMGGRNQEMTFGLGRVKYSNLYLHSYVEYAKENNLAAAGDDNDKIFAAKGHLADKATDSAGAGATNRAELVKNALYEDETAFTAADVPFTNAGAVGDIDLAAVDGTAGEKFQAIKSGIIAETGHAAKQEGQLVIAASEGMLHTNADTDMLTSLIEGVQAKINTARVEAGSQYAALESAVNYTTDLTAQYELGYNTVNDVNFLWRQLTLLKTKSYSRPRQRCLHRPTRVSRDYSS